MKPINSLLLLTLLFTAYSVNADSTVNEMQGEATIIVDSTSYSLALRRCYSASDVHDGITYEGFTISTHLSRRSKETGPRFFASGTKAEGKPKANYRMQINGGAQKGGIDYRGEIPYENYKDNKLVFVGKANSSSKKGKKVVNNTVRISIAVVCNK